MTAKKPGALRLLEGNPGRRPIKPEVKGVGVPRAPTDFNEAQIEIWNELVQSFPDGYLTLADSLTLERATINIALYRRCRSEMKNEAKLLHKDASHQGRIVKNPSLSIQLKVEEVLSGLTKELGLSPLARSRIDIPPAEPVDPMDRILAMSINGKWRA